jgi:polyisoprenoid-binding protein YceI
MQLLIAAVLAATLYQVEPVNGTVSFTVMKWGVIREEGNFRDFNAEIHFDRHNPSKSRVAFEVKTASIDTKNDSRDGTLRSEDFFHVARHPKLTFRSVSVRPRGKTEADVTGDLTIRGVTKRITVPVKLIGVSKQGNGRELAGFETEFKIDRRAFGVTGGRWASGAPGILGNEVTIRVIAGGVTRR